MDLGKLTAPQECGAYLIFIASIVVIINAFTNNLRPSLSIPAHNPASAAYD